MAKNEWKFGQVTYVTLTVRDQSNKFQNVWRLLYLICKTDQSRWYFIKVRDYNEIIPIMLNQMYWWRCWWCDENEEVKTKLAFEFKIRPFW